MNIRNKPCPCGSGTKFKKCCGNEAAIAEKRAAEHAAFLKQITERQEELEKQEANTVSYRNARPGVMAGLMMMSAIAIGGGAMFMGGKDRQ